MHVILRVRRVRARHEHSNTSYVLCMYFYFPNKELCLFFRVLRMPFGRVHFAGTITASLWAGYMEGAVESGERAALEVSGVTVNYVIQFCSLTLSCFFFFEWSRFSLFNTVEPVLNGKYHVNLLSFKTQKCLSVSRNKEIIVKFVINYHPSVIKLSISASGQRQSGSV